MLTHDWYDKRLRNILAIIIGSRFILNSRVSLFLPETELTNDIHLLHLLFMNFSFLNDIKYKF